ncbi:hypothetical protein Tco_1511475, partial [Tanacetum coccineum]
EASEIGICCIGIPAFEIRSVRIRLCDVELLLLALSKKDQHIFDVLKAKPIEGSFLEFNLKSVEISDLNASLQEKVLVITALKDDLRKLKGKALVDNDVTKHPSDPEMFKIDVEPITPKLSNKKTAHSAILSTLKKKL